MQFVSSNALIAAIVGAVVGVVGGGYAEYAVGPKNAAAANAATIKAANAEKTLAHEQQVELQRQQAAARAQKEAALRHDASEVTYGLGPGPHGSGIQLSIDNASHGWVRDVTLHIPVPAKIKGGSVTLPNLGILAANTGFEGELMTSAGAYFTIQLADIPPCEQSFTPLLSALPTLQVGQLLPAATLFFTDSNGNAWKLPGDHPLSPDPANDGVRAFASNANATFGPVQGGCS